MLAPSTKYENDDESFHSLSVDPKSYDIGGALLTSAEHLTSQQEFEIGKMKSEASLEFSKALLSNSLVQHVITESLRLVLTGNLVHRKGNFDTRKGKGKSSDQFSNPQLEALYFKLIDEAVSREEKISLFSSVKLSEKFQYELVAFCKEDKAVQNALKRYSQLIEPFIVSNYGLVLSIARRHSGTVEQLEDNFSRGVIGLHLAAQKYDPTKGYRFSTYSTHWIRREIIRGIQNEDSSIRLPSYVHGWLMQIEKLDQSARVHLGRELKEEEILELTGDKALSKLKIRRDDLYVASLDDPLPHQDNVGTKTIDSIADPDEDTYSQLFEDEKRKALIQCISKACRTDPQKEVLYLKYGLLNGQPMDPDEIAERLRCTRKAILQMERTAIKNCKRYAKERGIKL
jgi:RNA polymerase sigma factor (sigma-70 family)